MDRARLGLLLLPFLAGCGSWTFVSFPHSYMEPPLLPLEGMESYAVIVKGQKGAEYEDPFEVKGLERAKDARDADILVWLTLEDPKDEHTEVLQARRWTASGRPAFTEPRFMAKWAYTCKFSYRVEDRARRRLLDKGESTYHGEFRRDGSLFSTEEGAAKWALESRGTDWVSNLQLAEVAINALKMLRDKVDDMASRHPRIVRMRVAKEAPDDVRFTTAYNLLKRASRPADGKEAAQIYEDIGPPLRAAEDPEDANNHHHAIQCGLAAANFVAEDYRQALARTRAAIGFKPSSTLDAFAKVCETMIKRTSIPPVKKKKKQEQPQQQ